MASSIKVVLRKKKTAGGAYPLAVRITKDRKSSFIFLGHELLENQWDAAGQRVKKNHPNSVRLNNLILAKKTELSDQLIDLQVQKKDTSIKAIRRQVQPKGKSTFFRLAAELIDNMRKEGKYNRVLTEESRLKHFKEFAQNEALAFSDIDVSLLNRFRAYLKSERRVSERTIVNHLMLIRTVYNLAINGNLIDRKHYPFGKGKISIKFPDSVKIGLTANDVATIEKLDLSDEAYLNHARNLWLVSYYFAGMRISDVLRLRWSDFHDERLHYTMGKNKKAGSLKTPEKVLLILDQYRDNDKKYDLIFPELKVVDSFDDTYQIQRKISYAVKRLNGALELVANKAKLRKKLSTHIARHTFGNISGDKIPLQMLQKLYRHSSITTTIGYQSSFIFKDADEALKSVIG